MSYPRRPRLLPRPPTVGPDSGETGNANQSTSQRSIRTSKPAILQDGVPKIVDPSKHEKSALRGLLSTDSEDERSSRREFTAEDLSPDSNGSSSTTNSTPTIMSGGRAMTQQFGNITPPAQHTQDIPAIAAMYRSIRPQGMRTLRQTSDITAKPHSELRPNHSTVQDRIRAAETLGVFEERAVERGSSISLNLTKIRTSQRKTRTPSSRMPSTHTPLTTRSKGRAVTPMSASSSIPNLPAPVANMDMSNTTSTTRMPQSETQDTEMRDFDEPDFEVPDEETSAAIMRIIDQEALASQAANASGAGSLQQIPDVEQTQVASSISQPLSFTPYPGQPWELASQSTNASGTGSLQQIPNVEQTQLASNNSRPLSFTPYHGQPWEHDHARQQGMFGTRATNTEGMGVSGHAQNIINDIFNIREQQMHHHPQYAASGLTGVVPGLAAMEVDDNSGNFPLYTGTGSSRSGLLGGSRSSSLTRTARTASMAVPTRSQRRSRLSTVYPEQRPEPSTSSVPHHVGRLNRKRPRAPEHEANIASAYQDPTLAATPPRSPSIDPQMFTFNPSMQAGAPTLAGAQRAPTFERSIGSATRERSAPPPLGGDDDIGTILDLKTDEEKDRLFFEKHGFFRQPTAVAGGPNRFDDRAFEPGRPSHITRYMARMGYADDPVVERPPRHGQAGQGNLPMNEQPLGLPEADAEEDWMEPLFEEEIKLNQYKQGPFSMRPEPKN